MFDLTGFQRDLLYVIAGLDDPHGTAIAEELDDIHGPDINPGQLYPNLDKLAEEDFINKRKVEPRKNEYSLTEQGEEKLQERYEWMAQYVDFDPSNSSIKFDNS